MSLSFKTLKALATGPQGKKLIAQARRYDTPENRAKAMAMVGKLKDRGGAAAGKARNRGQGTQAPPA